MGDMDILLSGAEKYMSFAQWAVDHKDDLDYLKEYSTDVIVIVLDSKGISTKDDTLMESLISLMCYAFYLGRTGKILQEG